MAISYEPKSTRVASRMIAIVGAGAAAALVTFGALASTGAFDADPAGTTSGALGTSPKPTTTVTRAPSTPQIASASPTVKAPPYGKE